MYQNSEISSTIYSVLKNMDMETCLADKTLASLSIEEQLAFKEFFYEWANVKTTLPLSDEDKNTMLIAIGFILGHNFVKNHRPIW